MAAFEAVRRGEAPPARPRRPPRQGAAPGRPRRHRRRNPLRHPPKTAAPPPPKPAAAPPPTPADPPPPKPAASPPPKPAAPPPPVAPPPPPAPAPPSPPPPPKVVATAPLGRTRAPRAAAASPAGAGSDAGRRERAPFVRSIHLRTRTKEQTVTEPGCYFIGRAVDVALRFEDNTVSRKHAALIFGPDRRTVEIRDDGGANGTFLNGQQIGGRRPPVGQRRRAAPRPLRAAGAHQVGRRYTPAFDAPPQAAPMNREEALALYRQMLLIRRFEERCAQLYVEGKIGGFLHLYIGQEAVGVGAMSLMRPDDYLITLLPRPRLRARPRHRPAPAAGRAVRQGHRHQPRQGRQHALLRRARAATSAATASWAATCPIAAGMGYGIRLRSTDQVVPLLLRRRRRQRGRLPRGAERERALGPARRLHHREQPLRHGHVARPRVLGEGPLPARLAPTASPAAT